MKCPVCTDATLVMADRQGIEIDYCPNCRGVWLDRGELDKIIERSAAATPPQAPAAPAPMPQQPAAPQAAPQQQPQQRWDEAPRRWDDDDYGQRGNSKYHGGYGKYHNPKRRKSLLGEIFDF